MPSSEDAFFGAGELTTIPHHEGRQRTGLLSFRVQHGRRRADSRGREPDGRYPGVILLAKSLGDLPVLRGIPANGGFMGRKIAYWLSTAIVGVVLLMALSYLTGNEQVVSGFVKS